MIGIDDLGFLLGSLPSGPLSLPPIPDGAIDPWTLQPLGLTASGDIPPLPAPVEFPIDLAPATPAAADASTAAADEPLALPAITLPNVTTAPAPAGTPITREEVIALLEELDATIYLMV